MSDDLDCDYSDKSDTESDNEIIDKNKTRKRKKNKSICKSVQRKRNLNSGLAYISTTIPAYQISLQGRVMIVDAKINVQVKY